MPKLLSQSIGHYLTIKQIKDEKNNFSVIEKINQLKNLIKCMKNKIRIVEGVERKRKQTKILEGLSTTNLELMGKVVSATKLCNIIIRKLDKCGKKYEFVTAD